MTKLGNWVKKQKDKAEADLQHAKTKVQQEAEVALNSIPGYFHEVTAEAADDWHSVTSTFTDGLSNAAQHVEDDAEDAYSTLKEGVTGAFDTVTAPISSAANSIEEHATSFANSVTSDLHSTWNVIASIPDKTYNALAGLPDKIEEEGSSVAHSLKKEAQVVWGDVTDPVKNLGRNVKKDLVIVSVGGLALLYILWHVSAPARSQVAQLGKRAAREAWSQFRENGPGVAKKLAKLAPLAL
jgi:phage-related protein